MSKQKTHKKKHKKVPRKKQPKIDWRKTLSKQTKSTLVDTLVELIEDDQRLARQLALQFEVETPPEALIEDTRQAIAEATDYDPRDMNHNFDYDYAAYETVQRNFNQLIRAGQFEVAMSLSLELMKSGSEQVEMSDEGLMTDDIEDCLRVVIKGLKKTDIRQETIKVWAKRMLKADRVGFICDEELKAL